MFQVLITTIVTTEAFSNKANYSATTVIASFANKVEAEIAIKALHEDGIDKDLITYNVVRLYVP